jgi:hypothetical protein
MYFAQIEKSTKCTAFLRVEKRTVHGFSQGGKKNLARLRSRLLIFAAPYIPSESRGSGEASEGPPGSSNAASPLYGSTGKYHSKTRVHFCVYHLCCVYYVFCVYYVYYDYYVNFDW